jgi:cytochrome P450
MQGRKNVQKKLTGLLQDRLRTPGKKHGDLLDLLVEELGSEKPVIDEAFAIDALAALFFGSFATISATLTLGLKLLTDNPKVVETLKVIAPVRMLSPHKRNNKYRIIEDVTLRLNPNMKLHIIFLGGA